MGKREEKREHLKQTLFDSALERIQTHGLTHLRARDITNDAGCSLGGLYNAYNDLDDLILHVNSHILSLLAAQLNEAVSLEASPQEILLHLAKQYLDFACDYRNLWGSLFEHKMHDERPIPQWYLEKTNDLFSKIAEPVAQLDPSLSEEKLDIQARTLFSAVHGIVLINLQERFIALTRQQLDEQLAQFVKTFTAGLEKRASKASKHI